MIVKEIEPGLLVSDCGRVFKESNYSYRGNTRIKYPMVVYRGQKNDVHRLVAKAFIPNPDGHPCVLHYDDNQRNNHMSNLRWGTYKDNMVDMARNNKFSYMSDKYNYETIYKMVWVDLKSNRDIAKEFGVSESRICQILRKFQLTGRACKKRAD